MPMPPTRSQRDMKLALDLVEQVEVQHKNTRPEGTKGRYQALCKEFPVRIRTMGLAQTLAFVESKKGQNEGLEKAHELLLQHVASILGIPQVRLLDEVQQGSAIHYMNQTRRLMEAWVYFKRFTVSVLTVDKEG
jgi:CRISPR-associated protein Cmr5